MYCKNKIQTAIALVYISIFLLISSCQSNVQKADAIYYNGNVYSVDSTFSKYSAFAVKDGKILALGSDEKFKEYDAKDRIDLKGKFVYPGFQDAHCHFYGYGTDLKKIWLTGTKSFEEVLDTLNNHKNHVIGGWIFGRGWDQNDWDIKSYPDNTKLNETFPETPVFLLRIDGHAALVNQAALDRAGITLSTNVTGGQIEKKNGKLTGLLIDSAVDLVYNIIPPFSLAEQQAALLEAQSRCFEVGLTSVTDAGIENTGLKWSVINLIDSLQHKKELMMRVNAMAAIQEFDRYQSKGKYKTDFLNVRSFKLYCDGSLGSRGACLLKPYKDQKDHYGFLIHPVEYLDSVASKIASIGFQLNSHCIGDSANRVMLKIYEKYIGGNPDARWRIEHAQVVNPEDFVYYKRNHIIPSMQPVHATSDMYWAEDRIGAERMKGAYALKDLMMQSGIVAAGSDFPVENINPLFGFYAAVDRKDQKGFPDHGFAMENALTKENALKAMTIWASYAAFTENETGSLEPGKFADFVILEDDILTTNDEKIWQVKVNATYINGKKVFQRGE